MSMDAQAGAGGVAARRRPRSTTSRAPPACSIGTVSKALNSDGSMRQETRDKVIAAAERIELSAERSRAEPASGALADGRHSLQRQLRPLRVSDRRGARGAPVRSRHRRLHVQRHRRSRASAGMSISCSASASTASWSPRGAPTGGRRSNPSRAACRSSMSSRRSRSRRALPPAGRRGRRRLAVEHLAALGRRRIAHVTGPERFEAVRLREMGWRKALAEAGLAERRASAARPMVGGLGTRGRRAALSHAVARRRTRSSAATIRSRAAPSMRCASWGSPCPDDVAVVGFDNWDVWREATRPPLTSVDMNLEALGREAGARSWR